MVITYYKGAGKELNLRALEIHYWLGSESSIDEQGAAALWTIQLDDHFNGDPVQYRECQGSESTQFMSYFRHGITYRIGGFPSAFHHVS